MERQRIAATLVAALATSVVALVALLNVGAEWWVVAGFVVVEIAVFTWGFWASINQKRREWQEWRERRKERSRMFRKVVEDAERIDRELERYLGEDESGP